MKAISRSSFSFSSRSSKKLVDQEHGCQHSTIEDLAGHDDDTKKEPGICGTESSDNDYALNDADLNEQKIEGFLVFCKRVRRQRYCILQSRTMLVFKNKPGDSASPGVPLKQIYVAGVKDVMQLDAGVRVALIGTGAPGNYDKTFVISSHKSKLVVVETGSSAEKERWLQTLFTIDMPICKCEKLSSKFILLDDNFDAHTAVTLLHKHRTDAVATGLVLDRLTSYADKNVDDVEFYIQQIVHLTVNIEQAAPEKLVNLLLSICRAKAYVEHLGNCIHLALQLFWLLEAKIADNDPKTYNLCAMLLMSIEAKVVNQHFELPSTQTSDDVTLRLMDIPLMKEKLEQMSAEIEMRSVESKMEVFTTGHAMGGVASPLPVDLKGYQPALLLQWMEKERQKRYKYFHQQRDFVKALSDISERMRVVDPPQNRKSFLPRELNSLVVPDMAYIPLGRVSDPFCRITRVLTDEGTVFSTHSRAPCLLCFEVIEDQVNSAGQRRFSADQKEAHKLSSEFTSDSVRAKLEAEVADLLTNPSSSVIALHDARNLTCTVNSVEAIDLISEQSTTGSQQYNLIRRCSKTAYDMGLSKLLSATEVFGEGWETKKERIRASSPYGHLPGWNVVSLISKSNDDIRQEVFAMQLITTFQDIFRDSALPLWLRPYRIVSTGRTCGLLETITDAHSLDGLKKKRGYAGLLAHFEGTYGTGDAFKKAQRNFMHSLAAYSVVCYLLQIKDRHNGNIMLDTEGHIVHIDFGFMLGIAPGGNWSFETAPFKLTKEMVDVLGGVSSSLFGEFVQLVALGLLAAQRQNERVVALVEIMMHNSTFPCFQGRDVSRDLQRLRSRFMLQCSKEQVVKAAVKMIRNSYKNKWTKRYDQFQKITNGIIP
ncbi:Phosphatidylinositol kinase (PIK-H2) [Plasmopara halstedii]|uniref:1-phosphatidylinositol 4-kinase n=1 Tax=Plasmopara halstedii TaxID=4781 RepID=A0A0P1AT60_PLAHL|nr:Phosphatidylinositol kinase (PIK-H2) [Plasmopara halstedii]CEG45432.1 Phosphatidylinositol kinase (PIK-H2) [Plasmopara halstedii]|eukprot:XP_024581801.1 Phosphatidylinositol kinase (PIK-H2) [Plasmopara halstedii]